jgi:cobalt/nickel transport system ATP-binding protein
MIKISSLEYIYEDGTVALKDINLNLDKGKVISVIGANGSGKSTLFLNILGILKPKKGTIKFEDKEIKYDKKSLRKYRKSVTMVFQDPDKQLFFSRVYDDMAFALRNLGYEEGEIKTRVEISLKKVKALDLKDKPTHFLSYGQKKRIAIGAALVMDSKVLLLDEPTSGLDPVMSNEIKSIVKDLSDEKKLVVSSHDMDFIYEISDYVYILAKGEIIGEGPPMEVFQRTDLLKRADLEKPWLVKIHQYLNLPLYKTEEELFKYNETIKEQI